MTRDAGVSEDPAFCRMDAPEPTVLDWIDQWASDARRRKLTEQYIREQYARLKNLDEFVRTSRENGIGHPLEGPHAASPTSLIPTAEEVRAWLAGLEQHGMPRKRGPRRPCSTKTLNNHLACVRKYFAWGRRAKLTDADPTQGIEWGRVMRRKGRALSAQQVWSLFEAAQQDEADTMPRALDKHGRVIRRAAFYRVLIATGIRAGAANALRVRDFGLNASPPSITVPADIDKSGQERVIPISATDRDYFAHQFAGLSPGAQAVRRPHIGVLQRDAKAAGVPVKDAAGRGIGWHAFRRWHGSEMDRQGFSIEQIRQRLGHRDIATTSGYLVRQLEEQQGVAETLSKTSRISLDSGHGIADDGAAKNNSPRHSHPTEKHEERPAPVVLGGISARAPLALPIHSAGNPPPAGRSKDRGPEQAPDPQPQWAQLDSNQWRTGEDDTRTRVSLLHRMLDLLDDKRTPGAFAGGSIDREHTHQQRPHPGAGPASTPGREPPDRG